MSDVPMAFRGKFEEQLATKLVLLPVLVQVMCVGVGDRRCHGGAGLWRSDQGEEDTRTVVEGCTRQGKRKNVSVEKKT
jgi:hypothetical protein